MWLCFSLGIVSTLPMERLRKATENECVWSACWQGFQETCATRIQVQALSLQDEQLSYCHIVHVISQHVGLSIVFGKIQFS